MYYIRREEGSSWFRRRLFTPYYRRSVDMWELKRMLNVQHLTRDCTHMRTVYNETLYFNGVLLISAVMFCR